MPSNATVLAAEAGHATCAKSTGMNSAKAGDVTSGEAADVGTADVAATEAAHVAAAKAAHVAAAKAAAMASTKASAAMASAATAASGLCAPGKQASGEHCACKNHHCSSFHDILHLGGRMFRHSVFSDIDVSQQGERQRRDRLEMGMLGCFLY
jgi:hypothetical protein